MKADKDVNKVLNRQLGLTLTAINQYFLHARMLKNWGFEALNHAEYKKSIKDMKASDELIQRIFMLEGLPNLQEYQKIYIGEDVQDIIACDLKLEHLRHDDLLSGMAHCKSVGDFVSLEMLRRLLDENEEQIDWLETQQELIEDMGVQKYMQSQLGEIKVD